jgi:6-phosphogluconolactonase
LQQQPHCVFLFPALLVLAATCSCGTSAPTSGSTATKTDEMLYAAPGGGVLNEFSIATIDSTTGAATATFANPGPIADDITSVNSKYLYILSQGELIAYSLTANSGTLTPLGTVTLSARVSNLTSTPNGKFLFSSGTDGIHAFQVAANGTISEIAGSPFATGTDQSLAVDPASRFLYAGDENGVGFVDGYIIGTNGALTPMSGSPFPVNPQSTSASLPAGIRASGSVVYVALYGVGGIAQLAANSTTGALTPLVSTPIAAGKRTANVLLAGNFLYANDISDGYIFGYAISSSGTLTALSGFPFSGGAATIAIDPQAHFLFEGTGFYVGSWSINSSSGTLTQTPLNVGTSRSIAIMSIVNVAE